MLVGRSQSVQKRKGRRNLKKKFIYTSFCLIFTVTLVSCGGDPVESAAKDACNCLKPLYSEMEKIMSAVRSGDRSVLDGMNSSMDETKQNLDACMSKLRKKHKEVDADPKLKRQITKRIQQLCPR